MAERTPTHQAAENTRHSVHTATNKRRIRRRTVENKGRDCPPAAEEKLLAGADVTRGRSGPPGRGGRRLAEEKPAAGVAAAARSAKSNSSPPRRGSRRAAEEKSVVGAAAVADVRLAEDPPEASTATLSPLPPEPSAPSSMQQHLLRAAGALDACAVPSYALHPEIKQKAEKLLELARRYVWERSADSATLALSRRFNISDISTYHKLSKDEVTRMLRELGMLLCKADIDIIWPFLDPAGRGSVTQRQFLAALSGPMPETRRHMVINVFHALDHDGDGVLSDKDLQICTGAQVRYGVSFLLEQFGNPLDFHAFCSYYEILSPTVDSDPMFEQLLKRAWGFVELPRGPSSPGVTRTAINVRRSIAAGQGLSELLCEACAACGHAQSAGDMFEYLSFEWISSVEALDSLSAQQWQELKLPVGLKGELWRRLGLPFNNGLRSEVDPFDAVVAPAGFAGAYSVQRQPSSSFLRSWLPQWGHLPQQPQEVRKQRRGLFDSRIYIS